MIWKALPILVLLSTFCNSLVSVSFSSPTCVCLNLEIFLELLKFSTQDVGFFWDGGGRKAQQVDRCFSQLICLGWGRGGEVSFQILNFYQQQSWVPQMHRITTCPSMFAEASFCFSFTLVRNVSSTKRTQSMWILSHSGTNHSFHSHFIFKPLV